MKMKKGRKGERERLRVRWFLPSFLPFLPSACVVAAREGREETTQCTRVKEKEYGKWEMCSE